MSLSSTYQLVKEDQKNLYVIHDEPFDIPPIRRLQIDGADTLAVNDLLRIALGKVDGFEEILQEYGIQFLTSLHTVNDVVECLHIDHLQATQLLAILGLGKRLYARPQGSLAQIRGVEDVYNYCRAMSHLAKEQLRILLINSRYQLIHEETLSIGGTESIQINPKDVFQSAVERRVTAVILVHNHPSGDSTPSKSDYAFTTQMKKAGDLLGIELLDHVIIGEQTFSSCLNKPH